MSEPQEELTSAAQAVSPPPLTSSGSDVEFRLDLAFPRLSDEMLQIINSYGQEESVPQDACLYTYGDRDTDMLVILSGEIESRLLVKGGGFKVFRSLRPAKFQWRAKPLKHAEIRCRSKNDIGESTVANLSKNLRLLMRAEGDIANIIVSACIWRRVSMIDDPSTAVRTSRMRS